MIEPEALAGINSVTARLAQGNPGLQRLLVRRGSLSARLQAVCELAGERGCPVVKVDEAELDRASSVVHQGVILFVDAPVPRDERLLDELLAAGKGAENARLFLILDGVTDPRNLGACLRSAATQGVDAVIVPRDNSASLTQAAIKTASGGASIVPLVTVVNLARCLEKLKRENVWIVGTALEAEQPLDTIDLCGDIAVVLGSEDKGIRRNTARHCDYLARIPMNNDALGFNVSVAAGICLYEVQRQRRHRSA